MKIPTTFQKKRIMGITSWVLLWLEKRIKVPEAAKARNNFSVLIAAVFSVIDMAFPINCSCKQGKPMKEPEVPYF